tara:strand:+ start:66261 stop:66824 length:564 start_codon:yes stop_codon:yes gene_type:complete
VRISHKHKFVFIAIPKTGTKSINQTLDKVTEDIDPLNILKPGRRNHPTASETKNYFNKMGWNWNEYFKFAFVRNPYDRLISRLAYIEGEHNINPGRINKTLPYVLHQFNWIYDRNNKNLLDFIGRFENLQADFDTICDKIKIQRQKLPHKNATNHKHYTEYYNDEVKELVARVCRRDIQIKKYEFGE